MAVFGYLVALRSNHQRETVCLVGQSLGKQEDAAGKDDAYPEKLSCKEQSLVLGMASPTGERKW